MVNAMCKFSHATHDHILMTDNILISFKKKNRFSKSTRMYRRGVFEIVLRAHFVPHL